jgi:CMP/dCMP kinase
MVVAIDGPAGAGKSSVARTVADRLGFTFLDTGAMYRSVALLALEREDSEHSEHSAVSDLAALARAAQIELRADDRVLLGGRDVSEAIREPRVSEAASRVAADEGVRAALVAKQQALIADGDWVAEGRDIATVVAPWAQVKVFLTASPSERARRRAAQLGVAEAAVAAEQAERDERDSTRAHGALRMAPDAVELDSTGLTLAQVVTRVVGLVEAVRRRDVS